MVAKSEVLYTIPVTKYRERQEMKRTTRIMLPVLILIAGFVAMMFFISMKPESTKRPPEIRAKIVETEKVELKSVPAEIIAYGRVMSAQPVLLYAEVSGALEPGDVSFMPAQSFSKGDLLIKIDDRQAILDLNSAKSDLMTALANVLPEIKVGFPDEYQVWLDYFNTCSFNSKMAPLPETDNPKIKMFLSRFNIYKMFFHVSDLEIILNKHYIYAPFDGSIVSADLRVGSTARAGTALGQIINLEQMEVTVPVEAGDIALIDRDKPVKFTSSEIPGSWTGRISRIGSSIDIRTQTVNVHIALNDGSDKALLHGVFLEAHIPGLSLEKAFAVPPKAIYEDRYVYVVVDGKLDLREVDVLRRETGRTIINGGIANDDILVVEIMQGVVPGMPAESKDITTESREE